MGMMITNAIDGDRVLTQLVIVFADVFARGHASQHENAPSHLGVHSLSATCEESDRTRILIELVDLSASREVKWRQVIIRLSQGLYH